MKGLSVPDLASAMSLGSLTDAILWQIPFWLGLATFGFIQRLFQHADVGDVGRGGLQSLLGLYSDVLDVKFTGVFVFRFLFVVVVLHFPLNYHLLDGTHVAQCPHCCSAYSLALVWLRLLPCELQL